jgi:hypothetical protein
MEPVSQSSRQKRRPWTAQDQIVAEVAAACGVSFCEIGRVLERSSSMVRDRLIAAVAENRRARHRRWRQENPDKVRENGRRWKQENPDKHRDHGRRWRRENAEKSREHSRRWYEANFDKVIKNGRRWKQENPGKVRENCRRRDARKRTARRQALHPVTRYQIDARFAIWGNRCAFCGADATHQRNHGRQRLTVEHVLALTKGGLDEASNIIPACTACNSSKSNSPIEDWYRQQKWFTEARWAKIRKHCPAAVVGQLPLALAA